MTRRPGTDAAIRLAVWFGAAMIANQVAAKATRDALFLSTFDVSALPGMFVVAAACSLALGRLSSAAMLRHGPGRVVSLGFAGSALLLLGETALLQAYRPAAAVALYLHVAVLGALLISAFWSLVNERFDPRTARRCAARIATGATLGGIVGGLVAERVAATFGIALMLPLLAAAHAYCAVIGRRLLAGPDSAAPLDPPRPAPRSAYAVLAGSAHLRRLGSFVVVAAVASTLADYMFKAQAARFLQDGPSLMRFFAVFHAALGIVTLLVQVSIGRFLLEKLGVSRTLAMLPAALGLGVAAVLAAPGLAATTLLRSLESVASHGLYRPSYEILYTPVPPDQKRSVKSLIDVSFERFADMLGGGAVKLVLVLAPAIALTVLPAMMLLLAGVAIAIALSLHRSYVTALQGSLEDRAAQIDVDEIRDVTTRSTIMATLGAIDVQELRRKFAEHVKEQEHGDSSRPRALLRDARLLRGDGLFELVSLLGNDELLAEVTSALYGAGESATEALTRALLDPGRHVAIRRRSARILGALASPSAVAALLSSLADPRFDVRAQSARALARIREQHPDMPIDPARAIEAALRELHVDRAVWDRQQLLDTQDNEDSPLVDAVLRKRVSRSLEHVFTLLALALDRDALRIAFLGLHTDDEKLRGTALEYLEGVLPAEVRVALWPRIEGSRDRRQPPRARAEVLADLYRSHPSIEMKIREAGEAVDPTE